MSPSEKNGKNVTSFKIDPETGSKELLLTIENTPEDRLDLLQQMTRLKLSLQKAHTIKGTNQ